MTPTQAPMVVAPSLVGGILSIAAGVWCQESSTWLVMILPELIALAIALALLRL